MARGSNLRPVVCMSSVWITSGTKDCLLSSWMKQMNCSYIKHVFIPNHSCGNQFYYTTHFKFAFLLYSQHRLHFTKTPSLLIVMFEHMYPHLLLLHLSICSLIRVEIPVKDAPENQDLWHGVRLESNLPRAAAKCCDTTTKACHYSFLIKQRPSQWALVQIHALFSQSLVHYVLT